MRISWNSRKICFYNQLNIIWLGNFKFVSHFRNSNRYAEALANYEKGLDKNTLDRIQLSETALKEHKRLCEFGIARTNIKLDNIKKGVRKCAIFFELYLRHIFYKFISRLALRCN